VDVPTRGFLDRPQTLRSWLGNRSGRQPHCCFLDDRQRVLLHLLHLRGGLSTALVSAQLDGESVARCADPPIEAEVSDGGTSSGLGRGQGGCSHWATATAGPALIWVRAGQEGPRPPGAVLIILALRGRTRRPFSICTESGGDDHYGELGN
jgi:hypothetical protein